MSGLILAAFYALRSVFAPGMMAVFIWSVLLTIAALFGFVIIMGAFSGWLALYIHGGWWLPLVGTFGSALIAWFLFPGIMPVIVSFFDNRIAALIERQDYPNAQPSHTPNVWAEFFHDVKFSFIAIAANIVVLPLYLIPGINVILFYGLNGYLLGREFFLMCARRHMPVAEAEALRRRHSRVILLAGIGIALLATVPIVNLFAPFWGIALMVHLYYQLPKVTSV